MKRVVLYSAILVCGFILTPPLLEVAAAARAASEVRHSEVRHAVVAASGDAAPGVGTYLPRFLNARFNARNEVAFDGTVTGPPVTTGVFVGDGRRTSAIALGTNPDPTAPSFADVFNPFITSNGDVVFQGNTADILRSDGRRIIPVVQDGDSAPDGGTLTPGIYAVNQRGAVVYGARISGSTATQGLFRTDRRGTVTIVRDDQAVPTGGRFLGVFGTPVINDRGTVAFFAEMAGGAADFGVFRGDGRDLTPVFVANQIAPGGATFADFGEPLINRHGQVAAVASLIDGTSAAGLFVGDGDGAVAIALLGQPAPKGGTYRGPNGFGAMSLNDRGEVAFTARLTGGTSPAGLFRGDGRDTATMALAGTPAPGTTGTFQSFDAVKVGADGRVAFVATLTIGVGGVDGSNHRGIWIGRSDEDLQLVVRTGEVVGGRALTRLPPSSQGHDFDMNGHSVLWIGGFGTARAVVLSSMPGRSADDRD